MSIAPTVIEAHELEEMLEKSVPCEAEDDSCRSHHSQPATWLFTHNGEPSCTTLYCELCKQALSGWIENSQRLNHKQKYDCAKCGARLMHYTDLIFRRL